MNQWRVALNLQAPEKAHLLHPHLLIRYLGKAIGPCSDKKQQNRQNPSRAVTASGSIINKINKVTGRLLLGGCRE
jgi:hypothetical protein